MDGEVSRFSQALDACPCAYEGNPLHLLSVDASLINSESSFAQELASPSLSTEQREFIFGCPATWGFPVFKLKGRPDPIALSETLFLNFERASMLLPTQGKIAKRIVQEVQQHDPDIVILMIADGLSYYDLPDGEADPCLVEGVSTTEFGYREVVGKPSLSQHLFAMGYQNQKAFTYFDVGTNELASDLHRTFGASQIVKVREFKSILDYDIEQVHRGYLQITTAGLDGLCHAHRDRPPISVYVSTLLERFEQLVDSFACRKRRVYACLTADHGILWRDMLPDREQLIDAATAENNFHPRYLNGSIIRGYARPSRGVAGTASLLKYPYLTRGIRQNEWGVHGGISAWESLVPLKIITT